MAQDSLFTKIIKGEIPSHKIYEDERTFAFLDIHPIQLGQVLVVTKNQVETFLDLSDDDYIALWQTVRKIAGRLKVAFPDKKRIGIMVEGLDVPHVHVKIFPISTGQEFRKEPNMAAEPDHEMLAEVAKKIRFKE